MSTHSVRRAFVACIISAGVAAAFVAPGTASATPLGEQCSGETPIKGRGSTFQAAAQDNIWNPDFNEISGKPNKNAKACGGTQGGKKKIKVEYLQANAEDRGSGSCIHAFGSEVPEAKYGKYAFCGTDEAPNEAQRAEMETHKKGGAADSIESIPIAQSSVAMDINLPNGCTAKSSVEGAENRLVLKAQTVEGIYKGTITKWSEITENGDELVGGGCNAAQTIKVVVRQDHSGTTHIFKEFLAQASENTKGEEGTFTAEEFGKVGSEEPCHKTLPKETRTWAAMAEGCENQRWPEAAHVERPASSGNGEVANKVAANPSSVGYVNLADSRAKFGGGGGTQKFWAEVQNNFNPKKPTYPPIYVDPAKNGDTSSTGEAACVGVAYANGKEKFPPKETRSLWNAARAKVKQGKGKYAICGLTYDLVLYEASKYTEKTESVLTNEGATSARDYLLWVINSTKEGGANLLKGNDYAPLSGAIKKKTEEGLIALVY
jgi:ABC-type phosphate transport system substrate-binding protein